MEARLDKGVAMVGGARDERPRSRDWRESALRACIAEDGFSPQTGCDVCASTQRAMNQLARLIGRMDGRIRFEKAIESGPLVRRAHIVHIAGIERAELFAGVQDRKLQPLINKLSQARILGSDELDELFAKAVTYLRTPNFDHPAFSDDAETLGGESEQLAEGAAREFMQWDEEQRMAHLGNIESEVASLRWRNAVLAEENRRLKLAYAAVEAIRNDLERDRAALLAAKSKQDNRA